MKDMPESVTFPDAIGARKWSQEHVERRSADYSGIEEQPLTPQAADRYLKAEQQVVEAIAKACERGICRTSVRAHAVERYGDEVVLPAFLMVKQGLDAGGYKVQVVENMSEDRWRAEASKSYGSLEMFIDWSRPLQSGTTPTSN